MKPAVHLNIGNMYVSFTIPQKMSFGNEVTCNHLLPNFLGSGRPRAAALPEGPGAGPGPRPAARCPGRGVLRMWSPT
jgi:hypothetical protein